MYFTILFCLFFSLQARVRTNRPMVMFVFFDGAVNRNMPDLSEVSAPLKAYGVRLVTIGVGPEVNTFQLEKLSATTDIFKARTFENMLPKIFNVAKQACISKFLVEFRISRLFNGICHREQNEFFTKYIIFDNQGR